MNIPEYFFSMIKILQEEYGYSLEEIRTEMGEDLYDVFDWVVAEATWQLSGDPE